MMRDISYFMMPDIKFWSKYASNRVNQTWFFLNFQHYRLSHPSFNFLNKNKMFPLKIFWLATPAVTLKLKRSKDKGSPTPMFIQLKFPVYSRDRIWKFSDDLSFEILFKCEEIGRKTLELENGKIIWCCWLWSGDQVIMFLLTNVNDSSMRQIIWVWGWERWMIERWSSKYNGKDDAGRVLVISCGISTSAGFLPDHNPQRNRQ